MAKAFFGIALWLCVSVSVLAANPPKKPPNWAELPPAQQQILAPLSSRWDRLSTQRKSMWLGIAERYPSMPQDEQVKVQRRLQRWVKLTPAERKTVRESFKNIQTLPPEKKKSLKEQWEEYNKLPEEKRRSLANTKAAKAPAKAPAPVNPAAKQ